MTEIIIFLLIFPPTIKEPDNIQFYDEYALNYMSIRTFEVILSRLKYKQSKIKTRQGYSFASHLSWFFTQSPRTTGIVGGDKFVSDMTEKLNESATNKNISHNQRSAAKRISILFKELDNNYRESLENEGCGNQIHVTITR